MIPLHLLFTAYALEMPLRPAILSSFSPSFSILSFGSVTQKRKKIFFSFFRFQFQEKSRSINTSIPDEGEKGRNKKERIEKDLFFGVRPNSQLFLTQSQPRSESPGFSFSLAGQSLKPGDDR